MKGLLNVEIENSVLTITISMEALKCSIESGNLDITAGGEVFISDIVEFGQAFKNELRREESDGTTPIHQMFDDVTNIYLENGELGIYIK